MRTAAGDLGAQKQKETRPPPPRQTRSRARVRQGDPPRSRCARSQLIVMRRAVKSSRSNKRSSGKGRFSSGRARPEKRCNGGNAPSRNAQLKTACSAGDAREPFLESAVLAPARSRRLLASGEVARPPRSTDGPKRGLELIDPATRVGCVTPTRSEAAPESCRRSSRPFRNAMPQSRQEDGRQAGNP